MEKRSWVVAAKKKGFCDSCLRRKTVEGKTKCQPCLDYVKSKSLEYAYGITAEEVHRKRKSQDDRCAICGKKFEKTPQMDHDHKTGRNRELLCSFCNKGLGFFREDASVLERAAKYIRKHKGDKNDY